MPDKTGSLVRDGCREKQKGYKEIKRRYQCLKWAADCGSPQIDRPYGTAVWITNLCSGKKEAMEQARAKADALLNLERGVKSSQPPPKLSGKTT